MFIRQELFGHTTDDVPVDLYTLGSAQGLEVKLTNYGGTIVSIWRRTGGALAGMLCLALTRWPAICSPIPTWAQS